MAIVHNFTTRCGFVLAWTATVLLWAGSMAAFAQSDPLPSWNDSAAKTAIMEFVEKTTSKNSPSFVAPEARIAVFDNDGTLWAEQPLYFQLAFAFDEIKREAKRHPEWATQEPFKSIIAGDLKGIMATGEAALLPIITATHAGMTTDAFNKTVKDWLAVAQHPTLHRRYVELLYQPQLELLSYLRAHLFKTFIVSGGGIEFMRVYAEKAYGIPPEQIIGSSGVVKFHLTADGKPELLKEPEVEFVDDGPGKPVAINRFIGRMPIFAFGNSDGDQQMLEYVAGGKGPWFVALLHHTDAEREWAYDRQSHVGRLDKALDEARARNWIVVDMKMDWKAIFPPQN